MKPNWAPPKLAQPADDYRYSTDAWLLASFAAGFGGTFFCDLGCGCGVIAQQLALRLPRAAGVAVERRRALALYARRNLAGLPVTLLEADLRHVPWRPERFDLVVCNPPFYRVDAGHINRHPGLAEARHTFFGDIAAFAAALRPALKASGRFCFIFPHHLHAPELDKLQRAGWHLHNKLLIRSFANAEPKLVCLALALSAGPVTIGELALYRSHRWFNDEAVAFLSGTRA